MTRKDKAVRIQKVLSDLYPLPPIPLHHRDPYTLLIAVLLSAQCTDVRVNQVAPRLFAQAETPEAMARLGVRQIETIIRPCGLAPAKPSTSAACPGSSSSGTPARCRRASRRSRRCRAWDTRRRAWSWPRRSASRRFRSTPTSTGWPRVGGSRRGRALRRQSGISSGSTRPPRGARFTCRSSTSDGSTARRGATPSTSARSARGRHRGATWSGSARAGAPRVARRPRARGEGSSRHVRSPALSGLGGGVGYRRVSSSERRRATMASSPGWRLIGSTAISSKYPP